MRKKPIRYVTKTSFSLLCLAMLAIPTGLSALICFGPKPVFFRIIDAVRYRSKQQISLDIEIIKPDSDLAPHLMVPGRRLNVTLSEPQHIRLKIGQKLMGNFSGAIDDLGSGRVTFSVDPAELGVIEEDQHCREIPNSTWEPFFDWLPHLKIGFITFWWLVTGILVYRRKNPATITQV